MNDIKIKLDTPQDYVELYKKMGCAPFMEKFFHRYDDIGAMCRVVHWSKAYVLSMRSGGGDGENEWCDIHDKFHANIVKDENVYEYLTYCPYSDIENDWRPHPRYYSGKKQSNGEGLVSPGKFGNNIWDDIYNSRIFYFLQYLWDPLVLDYENNKERFQSTDKLEWIRAFIPVLEIDSSGTILSGRKDMLDKDTFNDFEIADGYIKDKFRSKFGKFYKHTSANGLYYIGPPLKINNVQDLKYLIIGFTDWLEELEEYFLDGSGESTLKNISFDIETPGWNSYYKAPFSLHSKTFGKGDKGELRISLPIPSDKYLDYEYIKLFGNPKNIDSDAVKEICKKAGY